MANRAQRRQGSRNRRKIDSVHMLPTDIKMSNELVDGQPVVVVQFSQPNVTFVQALAHDGWRVFINDLQAVMKSKPAEHKEESETGSGLTIPGTEDVRRLGGR